MRRDDGGGVLRLCSCASFKRWLRRYAVCFFYASYAVRYMLFSLIPSFFSALAVYDGGLWVVSGRGEGRVSSGLPRNFPRLSALVMELEDETAQKQ